MAEKSVTMNNRYSLKKYETADKRAFKKIYCAKQTPLAGKVRGIK